MRVAALYDIHGNVHALEAVLAEIRTLSVDAIVIGGDFVMGPFPTETLAVLDGLGGQARVLRGNADREVIAVRGGAVAADEPEWKTRARWAAKRLTGDQAGRIERLPQTLTLDVDGLGPTLFCHATPRSDEEIFTSLTPDDRVAAMLAGAEQRVIVCGHTHMQVDRQVAGWRVVNAGSVGLAYQGRPAAFWALLGPDVELRSTAYEHVAAADAILRTDFPNAGDYARRFILDPPRAGETAAFFESLAQKQAAGTAS